MKIPECEHCRHRQTDYECRCFYEGFETADAEQCFEKIHTAQMDILEQIQKKTHEIANDKHWGMEIARISTILNYLEKLKQELDAK